MLCNISYGEEVAQRFGHFFIINGNKAIVQPISCKGTAVCCFGLCDFVFMVRENQILAACMDIKGIPQMMLGHNGAFDMPTGSAFAPRGCPAGFALFFGLPQNEVCRIFLCIINRNTLRCARNQLIQIFSGKLAIFREFLCIIINSAMVFIRKTLINQGLHHCDNTVHFLCYARVYGCSFYIQTICIAECFFNVFIGDFRHGFAFLIGSVDDFVINVREVLHIGNLVALIFQIASYGIKNNVGSCVADMDVIVHSRTANVHFYLAFLHGYEFFLLSCHSII